MGKGIRTKADMQAVDHAMDVYRPTIVINCASISDAEYCESHMVEAFKINALGARNLASASRRINAKMIQLSTDDIFDGKTSGRLTEYDTPAPQTVYGKSKLAGENYVRELNPKHLIIRSSWVYSAAKGNYFRTKGLFDSDCNRYISICWYGRNPVGRSCDVVDGICSSWIAS